MKAQSQATDVKFRRLFDEHFAEVRSYCLRRLSVADANDAVSEVVFVAWRKRDEVPADARPWLFAVARNVARNKAPSTVRANRLWNRVRAEPVYPAPGPELQVVRNAEDEALLDAVQSLPDKYAEVLRLWAWEWLTTPEIAGVLGCSVSAAEKRLSRALMRIRKSLGHADPHAIRREAQQRPPTCDNGCGESIPHRSTQSRRAGR
jgi:RNA polymerase sigma-70 factor (ECF subfamily)